MGQVQPTMKMPWGDELPICGYCPDDTRIQHAIAEIYRTYGKKVILKGRSLRKFGKTSNADSGVKTVLGTFGSVGTPNVVETFSTTNDIDYVVSSSGSDTGVLTVEGHTIDSQGRLTFVVQDVTLTGQTPAELSTYLARCNRMYVKDGTFASPSSDLVGDIYAYVSGITVTAGVPQTNANVKCRIVAGKNQTEKCATSISDKDFWVITQFQIGAEKGNASTVTADCDIEIRHIGGVFKPTGLEIQLRTASSQSRFLEFNPGVIVQSNADVRAVATTNTNDTALSGFMNGFLFTSDWSYVDGIFTINN